MQNGEVNNSEYNNIPDSPLESPENTPISPDSPPPLPAIENLKPTTKKSKKPLIIILGSIFLIAIVTTFIISFIISSEKAEKKEDEIEIQLNNMMERIDIFSYSAYQEDGFDQIEKDILSFISDNQHTYPDYASKAKLNLAYLYSLSSTKNVEIINMLEDDLSYPISDEQKIKVLTVLAENHNNKAMRIKYLKELIEIEENNSYLLGDEDESRDIINSHQEMLEKIESETDL